MGYYDNVKDNVKNSDGSSKPNFDTLREAAEETSESAEEKEGDDTEIEILEDGLSKDSSSSSGIEELGSDSGSKSQSGSSKEAQTVSADTSGLEDKLDKIIEQNDRMIEILESFGS
ncbi:hypothetical protein [Candidatus Nanohalococcus occultus]|uniref:hypothetical protein n=1 Tax=Candidatus Nanohalococcus occultus TaxID=2978047 RepID=UPI0039E00378